MIIVNLMRANKDITTRKLRAQKCRDHSRSSSVKTVNYNMNTSEEAGHGQVIRSLIEIPDS